MTPGTAASSLVVGLSGPAPTPAEAAWLRKHRPGGVILFARNCTGPDQLAWLCARLREFVPDLEIVADHEGGPVSQLAAALGRPPAAWTLGVLDDVGLTARVHAETARRLHAAGVDRVLGPVADVLTAPRNPVIGARAFGANSDLVTRHVVAAVTGLLDGGVRVCLKHWPGHGGGEVDTHVGPAAAGSGVLSGPFAAGVRAGADAVMVGHVALAESGLPATLDAAHLAAARKELAPAGRLAWYADDVTMGALRPAMAALGIASPDGEAEGLAEPDRLPAAWFDALAAAGCDRLLVRGLPTAAWPHVSAVDARPDGPATPPAPGGPPESLLYAEVRARAWEQAGAEFYAPHLPLAWWDAAVGDRWEVAAGATGPVREDLAASLALGFGRVFHLPVDTAADGAVSRLLVTSHRPLDLEEPRTPLLAEHGVCLVMGHPSLAASLRSYLGGGWRVGALYDVSGADLRDPPQGETKI